MKPGDRVWVHTNPVCTGLGTIQWGSGNGRWLAAMGDELVGIGLDDVWVLDPEQTDTKEGDPVVAAKVPGVRAAEGKLGTAVRKSTVGGWWVNFDEVHLANDGGRPVEPPTGWYADELYRLAPETEAEETTVEQPETTKPAETLDAYKRRVANTLRERKVVDPEWLGDLLTALDITEEAEEPAPVPQTMTVRIDVRVTGTPRLNSMASADFADISLRARAIRSALRSLTFLDPVWTDQSSEVLSITVVPGSLSPLPEEAS